LQEQRCQALLEQVQQQDAKLAQTENELQTARDEVAVLHKHLEECSIQLNGCQQQLAAAESAHRGLLGTLESKVRVNCVLSLHFLYFFQGFHQISCSLATHVGLFSLELTRRAERGDRQAIRPYRPTSAHLQ
jgi:hypothetical protein